MTRGTMQHGDEDARDCDDRDQRCKRCSRPRPTSGWLVFHNLDDDALAGHVALVLSTQREESTNDAGMAGLQVVRCQDQVAFPGQAEMVKVPLATVVSPFVSAYVSVCGPA